VRTTRNIFIVAALHFVAGFTAFGISYSAGMNRFDHGGEPSIIERVCEIAVPVLWFPFLQLAEATGIHGGGPAEWLLFFANSFLWGVVICGLLAVAARRFRHSPAV
jgi:hypothetical protein